MRRVSRAAGLLAASPLIASCGGDGVLSTNPSLPPPGSPTLTMLQDDIFTPRCALPGCHAGAGAQASLDLSEGHTYANLVGVPSQELAGFVRVEPGDAEASYLILKLEGDARIVGERMPFGGPYLSEGTIDEVRAWIDAGAADL